MRDIDETWQADLVEMIPYSRINKGFKYLLTVIDIISKYAWAVPVKSKNGKDVSHAMQSILRGNYKWYDILPTLISNYNNTKHRTIGMKPKDVTLEDVEILKERISKLRKIPLRRPKYKIGDKVRGSKYKNVFEKGYTPNWTTKIFTVDQVVSTQPVTYKLKDYQDQPISGGFYEEELLKVKYSDIYLVEKILRTRGNKVLVKWLGFDNSHNTWEDKANV
ncbi:uncharacterized protein LOC122502243 [Leptopilina heterotoma]|uniref:uncharacterized protein LOC122502243 n=1 Tax=Leptopilina heterotoma TaxID=63436 RepID=UPI001CAA00CF|nr:uncharacterized protein LOC122502243 [Leptopilina heterotoma]